MTQQLITEITEITIIFKLFFKVFKFNHVKIFVAYIDLFIAYLYHFKNIFLFKVFLI
jgi:hypothetical protein